MKFLNILDVVGILCILLLGTFVMVGVRVHNNTLLLMRIRCYDNNDNVHANRLKVGLIVLPFGGMWLLWRQLGLFVVFNCHRSFIIMIGRYGDVVPTTNN